MGQSVKPGASRPRAHGGPKQGSLAVEADVHLVQLSPRRVQPAWTAGARSAQFPCTRELEAHGEIARLFKPAGMECRQPRRGSLLEVTVTPFTSGSARQMTHLSRGYPSACVPSPARASWHPLRDCVCEQRPRRRSVGLGHQGRLAAPATRGLLGGFNARPKLRGRGARPRNRVPGPRGRSTRPETGWRAR